MPDKFLLPEDTLLLASFKITPLQIILLTPELGSAVLILGRELRGAVMAARSLTQAGRNQASTKTKTLQLFCSSAHQAAHSACTEVNLQS